MVFGVRLLSEEDLRVEGHPDIKGAGQGQHNGALAVQDDPQG